MSGCLGLGAALIALGPAGMIVGGTLDARSASARSVAFRRRRRGRALAPPLESVLTALGHSVGLTTAGRSPPSTINKALEDPIQGVTTLPWAGISFSESPRDVIQAMIDTRREAEAQRVILNAWERQISAVRRHAAPWFC